MQSENIISWKVKIEIILMFTGIMVGMVWILERLGFLNMGF